MRTVVVLCLGLAACQTTASGGNVGDRAALAAAREAVLAALHNPASARFGPMSRRSRPDILGPVDYVCGQVTARSLTGAMVTQTFAYKLSGQLILDGSDPDPAYRHAASLWCP